MNTRRLGARRLGTRRPSALVVTAALLAAGLVLGPGPAAGAAITSVEVTASCSFAPAVPEPVERRFAATLTVPDQVEAGSTFDAAVQVELDMGIIPAGIEPTELWITSRWAVSGPAGTQIVEVVTPTQVIAAGVRVAYPIVRVQVPAPRAAGGQLRFSLQDITYRLRVPAATWTFGPDCVLPAAPIAVASVPVVASTLTCLGHRVTIMGTPGDDVIHGTNGRDVIHGVSGNNRIYGQGGDDIICGGPGNDVIYGGPGNNRLDGGRGLDLLIGSPGRDVCTNGIAIGC